MELEHRGGNNMHVELNPEAKHDHSEPAMEGPISDLKLHQNAKQDYADLAKEGSILDLKQHPDSKQDASKKSNQGISSHLSSSSLLSLSDGEEKPSNDANDKAEQAGDQSPQSRSISLPGVSIQTPQWSMVSNSPRGGSGNIYATDVSSPMKSPPIQAMGRGYDPKRIPSSVFSNKPTTPIDWSVASNESLFSIHMGNNSFSKDSILLQGLDFTKPEEWNRSPSIPNNASESKSRELKNFTPNLPPVAEAATKGRMNVYVREGLEEEFHETPKMVSRKPEEDHSKQKLAHDAVGVHFSTSTNLSDGRGVPRTSSSDPRGSNESTQSNDSFAFPVLINDYGKGTSLNAISENHETTESQSKDPKSTSKVAIANWFSCFTCWPPRCC